MNDKEIEKVAWAMQDIARAIYPTGCAGGLDATETLVSSHTEAVVGLTASMCRIAEAIHDLAEAVREPRYPLITEDA